MNRLNTTGVRSMTGQGHASRQSDLGVISVEVRTVNHRGFKCSPRVNDSLATLESRIEALARTLIHRGSVHLNVVWRPPPQLALPTIDEAVLQAYYRQLEQTRQEVGGDATIDLSMLMTLPGVINSSRKDRRDDEQLWDFVSRSITDAFENLNEMRSAEGSHMADSLLADCDVVLARLDKIATLAPRAVENYRGRLQNKVQRILAENDIEAQPVDLLREVQIYADRIDISEEVTRMSSHLKLFRSALQGDNDEDDDAQREPTGRKLDFIIQEMFREANTIGSKSADAEVSAEVVEVKCAIERMRELVQNLE